MLGGGFHLSRLCLRWKAVSCSLSQGRPREATYHACGRNVPPPLSSRSRLMATSIEVEPWEKIKQFLIQVAPSCSLCYDQKQQACMFCSQWPSATPKEGISEIFSFFTAEDTIMYWRSCLLKFYKSRLAFWDSWLSQYCPCTSHVGRKRCLDVCLLMRHLGCHMTVLWLRSSPSALTIIWAKLRKSGLEII